MLQVLYKLKTAKVFDRNRSRDDKGGGEVSDEDPFAIQLMAWCAESRMLCVAGVSATVIIYRFSKLEVTTEVVQVGDAEAPLPHAVGFLCQQTETGNRPAVATRSGSDGGRCFPGRRARRRLIPCHSRCFGGTETSIPRALFPDAEF